MSFISKIKDNYLERKVKSSAIASGTNLNSGFIVGNWLADYPWTQASTNKPIADLLHIIVAVLNETMTKVEGKLASNAFYAVQSQSGSTVTYKSTAETPAAGTIYVDINDGNKVYRYDATTQTFVQVGVVRDIDDVDLWTP